MKELDISANNMTDPGSLPIGWSDFAFFALAFVFLYTQLFQFPFTPYYFEGDQLIPISNAMRLLGGEVMYRDFFHITPPGTELWYAALFSVFGVRVWILNFTILVLNIALVWLTWYFSRQLLNGVAVFVAPSLVTILGFRLFYADGSYRLFSVIFALAAVAALIRSQNRNRMILASALCGFSSFFVQPRGVVALSGIAIFLLWQHLRRPDPRRSLFKTGLLLLLPFAAVILLTQSYFAFRAGFATYYFDLVTFIRKYYANDPLSSSDAFFADVPSLRNYLQIYSPASAVSRFFRIAFPTIFFYALVPWAYIAFFIYRWRKKSYAESEELDRRLLLLSLVGLALAIGVSAPSAFRLSHVAVPAAVIFVWLISRTVRFRYVSAAVLLLCAVISAAYVVQRQVVAKNYLEMPAGRAAFLADVVFPRYVWVGEHTSPGDTFYEGHHPSFYFPFHLKNPTPMYVIRDNGYTPQFQVDAVLASLAAARPEYIAWPSKWSKAAFDRLPDDHLQPLWEFLAANYERQLVFAKPPDYNPNSEGDIEIWRRKDP